MGRWLAVRVIAFALRHGATADDAQRAMHQGFPHRDSAWQLDVIGDALIRNGRRARKIGVS